MKHVKFGVVTGSAAERAIHTGRPGKPKIGLWDRFVSPFRSMDTAILYGELSGRVSAGLEGRRSLPPYLSVFDAMCKYLESRTRVDFARLMDVCSANSFGLHPSREGRNIDILRILERFSGFLEDSDSYMFGNALLEARTALESNRTQRSRVEG
ncbi:hypothetical protein HYT84_01685 [Candidatus Micrarchaeota archaeon]|nr:hypothetical protein [Candidatus Micrarchaeota archaeon]